MTNETTERMDTRSEPGLRAVNAGQNQCKRQRGPSDNGTGDWRSDSQRGEKITSEMGGNGLHIERGREGEERKDRKAGEKAIGRGNLWLLVLTGNERADIKARQISFEDLNHPIDNPPPHTTTTSISMFISKFFVGILFVAAAHAAAIGQFSCTLLFHGNAG
jgi:hypothetical protein